MSKSHGGLASFELQVVATDDSPRSSWICINSMVLFTDDNENSFVQRTEAGYWVRRSVLLLSLWKQPSLVEEPNLADEASHPKSVPRVVSWMIREGRSIAP